MLRIIYQDPSGRPLGERNARGEEAVIDPVLEARGGIAGIEATPPFTHVAMLQAFSPSDDVEPWIWEAVFDLHEFPADTAWFAHDLMNELLDREKGRIVAAAGYGLADTLAVRGGVPGSAHFERWDDSAGPSFVLTFPLAPSVTFDDVLRSVSDVQQVVSELVARVHGLSANVKSAQRPADKRNPNAFICHSSRDKPFVRKLCWALRAYDITVWLDEEKILVGHDFTAKMEEGLQEADFIIVVLSPNFVNAGPWAQQEFRTALSRQVDENRIRVLPAIKRNCEIPGLLKTRNYADFRTNFDAGLQRLVNSIHSHSGLSRAS